MITLQQFKQQLNITSTDNDEELTRHLESGIAAAENYVDEALTVRTVVEEHQVATGRIALNVRPVIGLDTVATVDGYLSWNVDQLLVSPAGVVSTRPYLGGTLALAGRIRVTYRAGYTEPPINYQQAALIIAQHLYETQRGSKGAPAFGTGDTPSPAIGYALPNRARELLGNAPGGIA